MNPETALQNEIILELNRRGCFARNHTVGTFVTKYGGIVKVGNKGEADIWGFLPGGRAFFLEVKLPGKYPREDQRHFIDVVKKKGALAGVVRSVDDALEVLQIGKEGKDDGGSA